jgi:hypothetical protein
MANQPIVIKLMCVALVASIMFPLGQMVFPYVATEIGDLPFSAIEAVLSATIGFGIYAAFFV